MKKEQREKIFVCLLMMLVIIQPLLDLMWFNNGSIGEIFGFTIPTLVRFTIIGVLGLMSFVIFEFKRAHLFMALYVVGIGVYFVFHHLNAYTFHSLVPGNFDYNVIGEAFYLLRMCIPIALMYFVYNSKFGRKEFNICVSAYVLTMSGIQVVTNVLKIGIGSYSEEKIAGSIIDWFVNKGVYTFNQLASKGWFYFSIVSMSLVLLFPYMIYLFVDTKKKRYLGICALQAIALFMFGTKATSYSVLIVLGLMLLIYIFVSLAKKDYCFDWKVCLSLVVLLVGSYIMLQYCPATAKAGFDANYEATMDIKEEERKEETSIEYNMSEDNPEEIIRFFDNNYKFLSIHERFTNEAYPYRYDPIFWYKLYSEYPPSYTMQNRIVQEKMLQRVKEINNNPGDHYWGIGYTRTSNIFNLEKDFVYQYYSIGLIGAIMLVGPYILILLIVMAYMLLQFKKKMNLVNCSLVLGAGLTCCLAYYSGNTLETLGITIVMGVLYGYLLKINFKKS